MGCVQSAGAGANLTHPKPETENVPCELSFTAHPMAQQFCIKSIDIVSEARNVELYVDDRYERTAKGIMLTIKKGRFVGIPAAMNLGCLFKTSHFLFHNVINLSSGKIPGHRFHNSYS